MILNNIAHECKHRVRGAGNLKFVLHHPSDFYDYCAFAAAGARSISIVTARIDCSKILANARAYYLLTYHSFGFGTPRRGTDDKNSCCMSRAVSAPTSEAPAKHVATTAGAS